MNIYLITYYSLLKINVFYCIGVLWTGGKLLPGSNEIFDILRQKVRFYK